MNLNQITINVFDVEKSIEFYEKLGLKLIVRSLPNYARFECPNGEATFSLKRSENLSSKNGTVIYFEVSQLDDRIDELIKNGFVFDELPTDKPWLWREAHLTDSDNNQIVIYHAGENRKNPPWRII